jgi:hypothetical protein
MDAEALLDLESAKLQSTINPNTLGTRIRLTSPRQVDIWALDDDVWEGNLCSVNLSLDNIGVFFRYTEGALAETSLKRDRPVYEGYVAGQLTLKGWKAEACLSTGPQRNAILTATLRKQDSSGNN